MTEKRRSSLGLAVLATAAIAFPAGIMVADALRRDVVAPATGGSRPPTPAPPAPASASMRNPYSAVVRTDPNVLNAQRAVVEAMERACRIDRERCADADAARAYLDARLAED